MPSEIRKHYFLDRFVIFAPVRNLRPNSFASSENSHKLETATSRAIENDPAVFQITDTHGKWQVKVIANAFPFLASDNPAAYGKQEIVIETPEHNVEFSELPIAQIERIFQAYTDRVTDLYKLPDIRYVVVFKNDGPKAGASIAHAHSQIIAIPFIPPHVEHEAAGYDAYQRQYSQCPICHVLTWEEQQKVRIVFADKHVVAICPYAASEAYGVWIIPRRHVDIFTNLHDAERRSIAIVLKSIAAKLDNAGISFNFFLQDSLPGQGHHFILKIEPRTTTYAGFELATGVVVNPVRPEYAAMWYQGKIK